MNAIVGALRAILSLESAAFTRGLTQAQKRLGDFDKRMKKVGAQVSTIGAALSVASTGIALAVRNQLNSSDEMSKAAQKFGVPIEALSQLAHAAELSDVPFEALGSNLGRLSKAMVNSPAMFDALGIAIKDASGGLRPVQDVLMDVADEIARMPDGAEKAALAMKLFGKSGTEMIPLLNGGGNAIRAMMEEADALGLTITAETGAAAEQFNDNLTRLGGVMRGLAMIVTSALAPGLATLSDWLVGAAKAFQDLSPSVQQAIAWAAGLTVALGPLLIGLGFLIGSLGTIIKAFGALAALALANPIVLAAAAIAAGAAAIYLNWSGIAAFFTTMWNTVAQAARDAWTAFETTWNGAVAYFHSILDQIPALFAAMWEKVKALAAQWVADFLQIGRDIVEGLRRGIEEKWEALVAWFQVKVDGMGAAIKEALGIQSPSKVFREIGQFITEGLGLGISDNLPMVDTALSGVTTAIDGKTGSLTDGMKSFQDAARSAFTGFVTGAMTAKQALAQLLSTMATNLANKAFDGLFGGKGGGFLGNLLGGLFGGGKVKAFASGGVVSGPMAFPMASGAGIMGEAGPEAIMPLTRVGGKLGVQATGGGGAVINIDARGAQAGVAEQIAAAMQRMLPEIDVRAVAAVGRARARGMAV